jgi:hypothetical protein
VVFMLIPDKNCHTKDKYCRPISLTSFLLNILERLVDWFLKKGQLLEHPLAAFQYAYQECRSTETSSYYFVSKVAV